MSVRELEMPLDGPLAYLDAVADLRSYEVVDGFVLMSPAPTIAHQRLLARILSALADAAPPGIEALPAPIDWVLETGQVRQPDIVVVDAAALGSNQLRTPPLLAIEILSPGSEETDLVTKPRVYGRAGLRHYCAIEPWDDGEAPGTARIFTSDGTQLRLARTVTADDVHLEAPFPVTVPLRL